MNSSWKAVTLSHPQLLAEPSGLGDCPDDELKPAIRDTSKTITKLLNTITAFGLFSILALATPDVSLLGANSSLRVFMIGSIPFKTFVLLGPVVILAVRLSLYVYVNHWITLDSERKKRGLNAAAEIAPLQHPLLRFFTIPLVYFFVPILLVSFAWKGAAIPEWASILWSLAVVGLAFHIYLFLVRNPARLLPLPAATAVLCLISGAFVLFTFVEPDVFRRRLELSRADLSKRSFIRQNFKGANLTYSNISDSDLSHANLTGADLTGAVLRRAVFRTADLRRALFYNTNLEGVDFRGAKLEGADFNSATLLNADLGDARLINADLMQANLRRADLQRANFKGAKLFLSDLGRADLRNVVNLGCNQLLEASEWRSAYRSPGLACGATIPSHDHEQGNSTDETSKDEAVDEIPLFDRKTLDNIANRIR